MSSIFFFFSLALSLSPVFYLLVSNFNSGLIAHCLMYMFIYYLLYFKVNPKNLLIMYVTHGPISFLEFLAAAVLTLMSLMLILISASCRSSSN